MNIKNLYINVITKVDEPTDEKVKKAVDDYIDREKKKNPQFEVTDEKYEEWTEEAKHQLTTVSTQLRKIRKIPVLDGFVRQNIQFVNELGRSIMLKRSDFNKLCKDCSFPEVQFIDIMLDSKLVFCKIIPVDRQELALALAEKKISIEKYDELMQQIDE